MSKFESSSIPRLEYLKALILAEYPGTPVEKRMSFISDYDEARLRCPNNTLTYPIPKDIASQLVNEASVVLSVKRYENDIVGSTRFYTDVIVLLVRMMEYDRVTR